VKQSRTYAAGTVSSDNRFKYGTLSQESVCTENLTPFKQLLSSKGKCGFSNFLNPLKIYDSHFHSMGVHYKNIGQEHELIQTISVVLNTNSNQFLNWNLNSIFDKQNVWTCPFSKSTEIYFESIKEFENNFDLKPEMNKFKELIHFKEFKDERIQFEFNLNKKISVFHNYPSLSLITVKRYQTGFGLFEGGLVTKITNNINETIEIKFYDAIPWYFRIYFHKVEFKLNSKTIKSISVLNLFFRSPFIC
jgi:GPI-anchor transamidase subunit T